MDYKKFLEIGKKKFLGMGYEKFLGMDYKKIPQNWFFYIPGK